MYKIVFMRHGESTWNLENRFTGWTDVDLTDKGMAEASHAGKLLKEAGLHLRPGLHLGAQARDPHAVDHARRDGPDVAAGQERLAPERAPLRRAAGPGQGRDRRQVRRRAGAGMAPQLRHAAASRWTPDDPRASFNDPRYAGLPREQIPLTECLKDTVARVMPAWDEEIAPAIRAGKQHPDLGPRQQPARADQDARRHQRRRHRRPEHPQRPAAGVRARRRPQADPPATTWATPMRSPRRCRPWPARARRSKQSHACIQRKIRDP